MAADWIKMRVDLLTHPKVVRILSATSTDKFRVLGGLHAVWCVFDTHSTDGELKGYTPELLDHVIGWDGFSRAMESVGWLLFDGLETLALPEFDTHNGQSAKRRAEDQKRKKTSRHSVRNLSANDEDKKRTREEKRREENKEKKKESVDDAIASDPLSEINPQIASDFRKLRQGKKAPLTKTAVDGIRREAVKANLTLEAALAMCCERGWAGFKSDWVTQQTAESAPRQRRAL